MEEFSRVRCHIGSRSPNVRWWYRIAKAAVKSIRQKLKKVGLFRPITLWPFPEKELRRLGGEKRRFLVVEMSTGQMVEDVRLCLGGSSRVYFYGRPGGSVPTKEEIEKEILKILRSKDRK